MKAVFEFRHRRKRQKTIKCSFVFSFVVKFLMLIVIVSKLKGSNLMFEENDRAKNIYTLEHELDKVYFVVSDTMMSPI